ncbi:MAG: hypothetical protein HY258_12505 [Chloroflexi bacterium]|nr:hypothetical protein [Chloroflexota bacterium]
MIFTRRNLLLFLAGLALLSASLACGFGAAAPAQSAPQPTVEPMIAPAEEFTPTAQAAYYLVIEPTATAEQPGEPAPVAPPPAIPESRRLTLEYPPKIRTGDSDVIRLTLEVDTLGNITPTAMIQGNAVTGTTVQVPNLYDTHYVTAEARLDLAGVEVRPPEAIDQALLPGQSVTFYWSVRPTESGTYRGTAWMFLRFVDKVSGVESRNALSAQTVQIEATNFFGLTGSAARAAGGVGSVLGAILGFPFADDILKWLLNRLRKRS